MKDPWCSNPSQLPHARSAGQPAENRERGATAQFAPRWFLPLAVLGALVALTVFFLAVSPAAADQLDTSGSLAVAPGNAKLIVGWKVPENNAGSENTFYMVQFKVSAAPDQPAASPGDDPETGWVAVTYRDANNTAEIAGLTNGVSYDVRVNMVDNPWSDTASATPREDAVWAAILTVGGDLGVFFYGCGSTGPHQTRCRDALTDNDFDFEGVTYQWLEIKDGQPDEHLGPASAVPFPYPSTYFSPAVDADSALRTAELQFGSVLVFLDDTEMVRWSPSGQVFSLISDNSELRHQGWTVGQRVPLSLYVTSAQPDDADEQPAAPGSVAVAPGDAKLVAAWNQPENVADSATISYTVEYKATDAADSAATSEGDPATGWVALNLDGGTTDTEITDLTNGVSYSVRVKASLDGVDSPWSATVSATPHEDVIWAAILTVSIDEPGANLGCKSDAPTSGDMDPCTGALTEDEFEFGGVTYQWKRVSELRINGGGGIKSYVFTPGAPADSGLRQGRLQVGNDTIHLNDASDRIVWRTDGDGFIVFGSASDGMDWFTAAGQRVPLSLYAETGATAIETEADTQNSDSEADANLVTLPDNLSFTVSKGSLTTDTGLSTKFTIDGDCPPNGGGFRFQMVRAGTPWPAEGTDLSMSYWPADVPSSDDHFEVLELRECGSPDWRVTSEIAVDVISPGEKWEVRVYVWRGGSASDFSQVYYVIGWSVPSAPAGMSLTPGQEQLDVEWDGITAVGTDMPVNTHIRWRAAQVGQSGETDYAAAGPWNNDEGVATGGPTSHTITGLAEGTAYDVEVKAASPMGSSEWSAVGGETLPSPGDNAESSASTQESAPVPVVTFGHHSKLAKASIGPVYMRARNWR